MAIRDKFGPSIVPALPRTSRYTRILLMCSRFLICRSLGDSPEAMFNEAASIDSLSHNLSAYVHVPPPTIETAMRFLVVPCFPRVLLPTFENFGPNTLIRAKSFPFSQTNLANAFARFKAATIARLTPTPAKESLNENHLQAQLP
jgi:hypothetical protein